MEYIVKIVFYAKNKVGANIYKDPMKVEDHSSTRMEIGPFITSKEINMWGKRGFFT